MKRKNIGEVFVGPVPAQMKLLAIRAMYRKGKKGFGLISCV